MILVLAFPALKRWANEFRRYAADTGTLSAGMLSAANLSAANLYATNVRLRAPDIHSENGGEGKVYAAQGMNIINIM
jgi:hypothetical protein